MLSHLSCQVIATGAGCSRKGSPALSAMTIGIDFWHAVEFSRSGRASVPVFRPSRRQPFYFIRSDSRCQLPLSSAVRFASHSSELGWPSIILSRHANRRVPKHPWWTTGSVARGTGPVSVSRSLVRSSLAGEVKHYAGPRAPSNRRAARACRARLPRSEACLATEGVTRAQRPRESAFRDGAPRTGREATSRPSAGRPPP